MRPYRFCPYCASELTPIPDDRNLAATCRGCGETLYRNAKPCVGALVERDGKLLLARRGVEPFKGQWDVLGGFLNVDEDPIDGVRREVAEESGLEVEVGPFLGAWIDTYGADGDFTLNLHYIAYALPGEPLPQDDVASLEWFTPEEAPDDIAFENGRRAVAAWKRLKRESAGAGAILKPN